MTGRQIPPLRVQVKPSGILAAALLASHALALFATACTPTQLGFKLTACVVLLLHAGWTVWRYALLRASRSIVFLAFSGEDQCLAHRANGAVLECRVRPSSYLTSLLIVLDLERPGHRSGEHVVLFRDSLARDSHRDLRVRLRWGRPGAPPRSGSDTSL